MNLLPVILLALPACAFAIEPLPTADGYRGIWYQIKSGAESKYSGGMATYPQQIRPMAIYRKEANKTFFCYGGTDAANSTLLHMVSYFDHTTGTVPRPRILLDKKTKDAHDNPAIAIDDRGHIWIFSNTHGPEPRSSIHRSTEPYSIERFECVADKQSFSYGMPWYIEGHGFMFLHNRYQDGRAVAFMTSTPDGRTWAEPRLLAQFKGHYSISLARGNRVGVAFNYHPRGLDTRTNLYYIETTDFGRTWKTAGGENVQTPLTAVKNAALVHDYERDGLLVYLKDIANDALGNPVLVYLTSKSHHPGKASGPHQWMIAHWDGATWRLKPAMQADHNYDFGQLSIEPDPEGRWRLIAPTDPGPQPDMTGGDVVMWLTRDQGTSWEKSRTLTRSPDFNHTYVRRPIDARDDFYAFWCDGDARERSPSRLYFCNKPGEVLQFPATMTGETATPQRLAAP